MPERSGPDRAAEAPARAPLSAELTGGKATPPLLQRLLEAAASARAFSGTSLQELPDTLRDELSDAVLEYVDGLRDAGVEIVPTILAVKSALTDAPQWLRERSVTWCIEGFYRTR